MTGLSVYARSLSWLKKYPSNIAWLLFPILFGILSFWFIGWGILSYSSVIVESVLFVKPESYFGLFIYYLAMAFLYIGFLGVSVLSSFLVTMILSAPIYEMVSCRVEASMMGGNVEELSLFDIGGLLRVVKAECVKWLFISLVSVSLLFIPVLNIFSVFVTAIFLGWDFFDFVPARRGYSFSKRFRLLLNNAPLVFGFGVVMLIPLAQFFLAPLAVVGGTILALEKIQSN